MSLATKCEGQFAVEASIVGGETAEGTYSVPPHHLGDRSQVPTIQFRQITNVAMMTILKLSYSYRILQPMANFERATDWIEEVPWAAGFQIATREWDGKIIPYLCNSPRFARSEPPGCREPNSSTFRRDFAADLLQVQQRESAAQSTIVLRPCFDFNLPPHRIADRSSSPQWSEKI
jgi:hypothetical protein